MTQFPLFASHTHGILDVAIIGAGPAGSALSYYLHELRPNATMSIFESSSYIGGRTTTIDVLGETIELGASIFVDVNRNLKNAVKDFDLTIDDSNSGLDKAEDSLAIWNGSNFVYTDSGSSYWSLAKLVWKYGLAPYRAKKHVDSVINKFLKVYEQIPNRSLYNLAASSELLAFTNITGSESYADFGVSPAFYHEIINAATRVNYAQEITKLHGLMSAVSFVTEDSMAVRGGNWQIFAEMVRRSEAFLHLDTRVATISKRDGQAYWTVCTVSSECNHFRHVVVTAPAALNGITITPLPAFEPVEYVCLHVTVLATKRRLSPAYFHLAPGRVVPGSILTTTSQADPDPVPPFQSISIVGKVAETGTLIYKIFSLSRPSDELLDTLFAGARDDAKTDDRPWLEFLYRHTWHAYPYGNTTTTFDDFELLAKGSGLWYTSTMERFISTMETATLAAKNVAHLIHENFYRSP